MTHSQTMTKVVLPQVIRNILPAIGNETVINIKDTAVLSVISVGDLFFQGTASSGTTLFFLKHLHLSSLDNHCCSSITLNGKKNR